MLFENLHGSRSHASAYDHFGALFSKEIGKETRTMPRVRNFLYSKYRRIIHIVQPKHIAMSEMTKLAGTTARYRYLHIA